MAVPEAELDELRSRIRDARWPEQETVHDWSQGVPLAWLRKLCAYWADGYDWRAVEARANAFPQFRAGAGGIGIHFLHVRSRRPDALPLVLTHGWPGSVLEYLDVLAPLSEDFHVVCPSLPGYGFSDKPSEPGWGVERIADAWAELMRGLGYERFGAQGSDWGTSVSTCLGARHRARVVGLHLVPPLAPPDPATMDDLTDRERDALAALELAREWDSGYSRVHATRPQTVGYALTDSPVGLCAWIAEKLAAWADAPLPRDAILDVVTLYWLTRSGASSARLYWESIRQVDEWISGAAVEPVDVPVGCSVFPAELQRPSQRWAARRFPDIRYWSEPARGGHFAALEEPSLFVEEVRACFGALR
jgi:pimeloyl-ACP methyl ester carboxylesterase